MVERSMPRSALIEGGDGTRGQQAKSDKGSRVARSGSGLCTSASPKGESRALQAFNWLTGGGSARLLASYLWSISSLLRYLPCVSRVSHNTRGKYLMALINWGKKTTAGVVAALITHGALGATPGD
jgi:hypothetical protein